MERMSLEERRLIRERINRSGISPGVGSVHYLLDTIESLEQELKATREKLDKFLHNPSIYGEDDR